MRRQHGKRSVSIRYTEKSAWHGIHKRMRDQGGKQRAGKSSRSQHGQEESLQAHEDSGKCICVNTGDDPADGSEDYTDKGSEQDLQHENRGRGE